MSDGGVSGQKKEKITWNFQFFVCFKIKGLGVKDSAIAPYNFPTCHN